MGSSDPNYGAIESTSSVKVAVVVSSNTTSHVRCSYLRSALARGVFAMQVRPLIDLEKAKKAQSCVQVEPPNKIKLPPMQFSGSSTTEAYNFDYDRVYKLDSKEESRRLFVELVQPLLDRFLMGFNVTVCGGHGNPSHHVLTCSCW